MDALAVPGLVLMENAGRGATDALVARFPDRLGRVLCVGGPGQNGGDAWVVARHLHARGVPVVCWRVGDQEPRGDAAANFAMLRALGVPFSRGDAAVAGATLLVDGVFGTGLARPVEGVFAEALRALAGAPAPVLALDVPSGIDADTGQPLGMALPAALTCTFGALKPGLVQHPGRGLAGEVVVCDLGVPPPPPLRQAVLERDDIARFVAPRRDDAHKGHGGHVLVLGGTPSMLGAAQLAARGALRAGAGRVTLGRRGDPAPSPLAEVMSAACATPEQALAALGAKQAVVLGPGLGLDAGGRALAQVLARAAETPAVLDADALTAIAGEGGLEALQGAAPRVLTPHPGEASRLLGRPTEEVQAHRFAAARELASRAGQVTVLKGAGTIVAAADGRCRVVLRGTPALAVAGSGDVLAGACGALLAQGLAPFEAASAAAWVHAVAGEVAAAGRDRGLLASEVADALSVVIGELAATAPQAARR